MHIKILVFVHCAHYPRCMYYLIWYSLDFVFQCCLCVCVCCSYIVDVSFYYMLAICVQESASMLLLPELSESEFSRSLTLPCSRSIALHDGLLCYVCVCCSICYVRLWWYIFNSRLELNVVIGQCLMNDEIRAQNQQPTPILTQKTERFVLLLFLFVPLNIWNNSLLSILI